MIARYAIVAVPLIVASPTLAENLYAEAARRFVTGNLFAFDCFDGSRGAGRIYGDGSVIGSIQLQGSGLSMVAGGNAQGQRRGGLRLDQGHPDRTVLRS